MEKSNNIQDCMEYDNPKSFDSPEKVADWMREKDFAFDFRNNHWSKTGGLEVDRSGGYIVPK